MRDKPIQLGVHAKLNRLISHEVSEEVLSAILNGLPRITRETIAKRLISHEISEEVLSALLNCLSNTTKEAILDSSSTLAPSVINVLARAQGH